MLPDYRPGDTAFPGTIVAELIDTSHVEIAAKLPELSLGWHYRSKHEDLIAFANRQFYADRLHVLPAAGTSPELGIAWRRVDGTFTHDGDHTNVVEADAIVTGE